MSNPFFSTVQRGIEEVARERVALADVVEPGLAVDAQDPAQLGRRAAQIPCTRLDGDAAPSHEVSIAPTLVRRGSGELKAATS